MHAINALAYEGSHVPMTQEEKRDKLKRKEGMQLAEQQGLSADKSHQWVHQRQKRWFLQRQGEEDGQEQTPRIRTGFSKNGTRVQAWQEFKLQKLSKSLTQFHRREGQLEEGFVGK